MRRHAALPLLAVSAAATACLSIPRSGLDGWHGVEIREVRVLAEAGQEELGGLAADLAHFDAAFAYLTGGRIEAGGSTTLALVRHPELVRHLGVRRGVAGWALPTLEGGVSCIHLGSSTIESRAVLLHEYTHLLLFRGRRAPLPRWYDEGLAVYFSTLGIRDGVPVVGAVPAGALSWLASRGPLPLERLFAGSQRWRGAEVQDFYATAWALSHHLLASPSGRRELTHFVRELSRGTALDAARQGAFGRPWEQLDAELERHLGYLRRGVAAEVALDPRRLAPREAPTPRPLLRAEVAEELGSLALALADESGEGRPARLAAALLRIALDEDPSNARAWAALAEAKALRNDARSAEAAIGAALREAPNDPRVLLGAGRVALAAGDPDRAASRFRAALTRDAASAAAWLGLGRALAAAGRPVVALEAFERARSMAWSDQLDLEIGRLHLAADRADQAYALLWPLAQDPHGGPTAAAAAELLEEAGLGRH